MGLYEVQCDGEWLVLFEAKSTVAKQVEEHLETWLERNDHMRFEGQSLLWFGHQASTNFGALADLTGLALDHDGCVVIVTLKRTRTQRMMTLDPNARRRNREIVHRLIERLNQDHASTLQKFVHPFRLYQGRSDQGATAYVDFRLGDQKMAVNCWVDEDRLTIMVFPRSQKARQTLVDWWNSSPSLAGLGFAVDTEKERPITNMIQLAPDQDPVEEALPQVSALMKALD